MTIKPRIVVLAAGSLVGAFVLFVLFIHTTRFPDTSKVPTDLIADPQAAKAFSDRLQFLWSKYMDMIQLTITLLTGTIALSAGLVKLGKGEAVADRGYYAAGMAALLFGLMCAILWRIDAQLLMEVEVFGNPARTHAFFQAAGVPAPFTSSYTYASSARFFGKVANLFMMGAATSFLSGLGLLALFTLSNLPAASRARSRWRSSGE